jgi:hypothetical protein
MPVGLQASREKETDKRERFSAPFSGLSTITLLIFYQRKRSKRSFFALQTGQISGGPSLAHR